MTSDTSWTWLDQPSPELVWLMLGVALLVTAGASAVRVAGPDQRAVVTRLGRPCRVRGPGLVLTLPGLEQVRMVSLSPTSTSASLTGSTTDGTRVTLTIEVLCRVDDPVAAVESGPAPTARLLDELERSLHHEVAAMTLPQLLRNPEPLAARLQVTAGRQAAALGMRILDVEVTTVQVELSPEVLRWVR